MYDPVLYVFDVYYQSCEIMLFNYDLIRSIANLAIKYEIYYCKLLFKKVFIIYINFYINLINMFRI